MRKIVTCTNVSLDGVMQAPARADEDARDGFRHGGWAAPYAAMTEAGRVFAESDALLFGRRTYEDFYDVWPKRPDSPFTPWLTGVRKYVASRTLSEPLPWANSTLLSGDVVSSVRKLKAEAGKGILVLGSGALIRSLTDARLIDEYVVLVHPVVLGSGKRLFGESDDRLELFLVESKTTSQGVVIATYRPAR